MKAEKTTEQNEPLHRKKQSNRMNHCVGKNMINE